MLRAVIVDDNPLWLDKESRALIAFANERNIELPLSVYHSHAELFEQHKVAPDVLFSDIELGDGPSGIDLVRAVNGLWPDCQVVYVTNHLRYAPEVYVTDHIWYVLKEDFERRLPEIMIKLADQLDERGATIMAETTDHQLVTIKCADVLWLARHQRLTTLAMTDGTHLVTSDKLSELLERMQQRIFARCHGSYAVNLSHVQRVGKDAVTMDDGSEVPLSRRFAPSLRAAYLAWVGRHVA